MKYNPMMHMKLLRVEKGLSQKELARLVGVSQNTISSYELGIKFPRRGILDKLARELGCEAMDLI